MGNREDLLEGARKCLLERGYAKTTARDIAEAAGVSLAAIGYHFGSKERLLTEALTQAMGSGMGDDLEEKIRAGAGRSLAAAFPDMWDDVAELFARHREAVIASFENQVRIQRSPDSREFMLTANEQAVGEFRTFLTETYPDLDEAQVDAVARFYFTLLNGLAVSWAMGVSLPTGAELALAVRSLAGV